jgi:putative PIN family toxin of toxin-antitoxin system
VLEQWLNGWVRVVTSVPLLEELYDVLSRPRLRRRYTIEDRAIVDLLRLIAARAILVPIAGHMTVCRDPDDNMVIETAIEGHARYLVTRDEDLKGDRTIRRYLRRHKIHVMSVSRFLALIEPRAS